MGPTEDLEWRQLTWRESYWASIEDSRRRVLLHCELRELSDWLILFGVHLETCRFVEGGYGFIDNHGFRDRIGHIKLYRDRLNVVEFDEDATVTRSPHDWGWVIQFDNGLVSMASVDRMLGPHAHQCALSHDACGRKRSATSLFSTLLRNPCYALFPVLKSCEARPVQ